MEEIEIMGCKIPRYIDCPRCKKKLCCKWAGFAYSTPCDDCKNTERYEQEQKGRVRLKDHIGEAFKNQQTAGVWNYKGRTIYTNHKGDIIADEPYKPLKSGDPNWK